MGSVVKLDGRTRLVLPLAIRRDLNLKAGDCVWVDKTPDGRLEVVPLALKLSKAKGLFESFKAPGEQVVDEFIAERREEARGEKGAR